MKTKAIVYTSNTGYTRRYASMLGERTGLPVYDLAGPDLPPKGTEIVYLGWLMAGSVRGLKKAKRRWRVLALCPVGMAPGCDEERIRGKCPGAELFYLQGGYDHDRLTGMPKKMMNMLYKTMKKKGDDPAAVLIVDAVEHGGNWVSADKLEPLLAWLGG